MDESRTFEEMLDFAIGREAAAAAFYADLAQRATQPAMQKVYERLSAEERGHQSSLTQIKADPGRLTSRKKVTTLSMADYMVAGEPTPETPYDELLVIAMKREAAAVRLYKDMAGQTDDEALRKLLLGLADEEGRHQLRFEKEYDEYVLLEN
jgi:rubrerythrin